MRGKQTARDLGRKLIDWVTRERSLSDDFVTCDKILVLRENKYLAGENKG